MQGAYALLMVCNQAWAMQTGAMPATQHPRKLLAQCEQGLYSLLSTLDNYAVAFEAIRGMRGEVTVLRETHLYSGLSRVMLTSFLSQIKFENRSMGLQTFSPATSDQVRSVTFFCEVLWRYLECPKQLGRRTLQISVGAYLEPVFNAEKQNIVSIFIVQCEVLWA